MQHAKISWKSAVMASCLLALSSGAGAQEVDRARLTHLVPLPKMESGFSLGFSGTDGSPDDATAKAEIQRLEKLPAPADAERLLKLARLHVQLKDQDHATQENATAIALLRKGVAAKPNDAHALFALGAALRQDNQLDEAATVLRRSTKLDPQNPHAWTKLSDVLTAKATHEVLPSPQNWQFSLRAMPALDTLGPALLNSRPKAEIIAGAQAELEEANAGYIKALLLAPNDFDVNSDNIGFQLNSTFLTALLTPLKADPRATIKDTLGSAAQALAKAFFAPGIFARLQTLAQLRPDDASLQAMAGLDAIFAHLASEGGEVPIQGGLGDLPPETAAPVKEAITELEAISKAGGKNTAKALEALGCLYFVLGDPAATDRLQRAVSLDPSLQQSWEMLVALLASDNKFTEMAQLVETRLKTQDTARNHMLLAKAYDKLDRPGDSAAQVGLALKSDPNDVTANLAQAAIWLRSGETTKASALLAGLGTIPDSQKDDYALFTGVSLALSGQTEAARTQWQKVLDANPQNDSAKQMLATLPPH